MLAKGMCKAEFLINVCIGRGQISNDQIRIGNSLHYVGKDIPLITNIIRANNIE